MMNTRFGKPFGESFDGTSQKVLVINIVRGVQVRWVSVSSDEAAVRMFGRYSLGVWVGRRQPASHLTRL